jgi:hypothetical protein
MTAHPVWFKDDSGKWSQINGVTDVVVASPLVARGTTRDKPPVIAGGAAVTIAVPGDIDGTGVVEGISASAQISGGVSPTVDTSDLASGAISATGASSVEQDDDYTHEPLRYVFGPEPVVFFKTSVAGSPNLPDDTTFSTDRPPVPTKADLNSGGFFPVFEGDCFFPWTKNCGVTNTPPQGWTVFTGA